eukprot:3940127-Rhodomonas_salina.3
MLCKTGIAFPSPAAAISNPAPGTNLPRSVLQNAVLQNDTSSSNASSFVREVLVSRMPSLVCPPLSVGIRYAELGTDLLRQPLRRTTRRCRSPPFLARGPGTKTGPQSQYRSSRSTSPQASTGIA